jgi:hypothetical protein
MKKKGLLRRNRRRRREVTSLIRRSIGVSKKARGERRGGLKENN